MCTGSSSHDAEGGIKEGKTYMMDPHDGEGALSMRRKSQRRTYLHSPQLRWIISILAGPGKSLDVVILARECLESWSIVKDLISALVGNKRDIRGASCEWDR